MLLKVIKLPPIRFDDVSRTRLCNDSSKRGRALRNWISLNEFYVFVDLVNRINNRPGIGKYVIWTSYSIVLHNHFTTNCVASWSHFLLPSFYRNFSTLSPSLSPCHLNAPFITLSQSLIPLQKFSSKHLHVLTIYLSLTHMHFYTLK